MVDTKVLRADNVMMTELGIPFILNYSNRYENRAMYVECPKDGTCSEIALCQNQPFQPGNRLAHNII
jgi:hypothetical protein